MSSTYRFASVSAAAVLAAVVAAGCIQGPHSLVRSGAAAASASGCSMASEQQPEWSALVAELRTQGLTLDARCAQAPHDWTAHLLVLDSARASQVLRGPLADGEPVDMGAAAGAAAEVSPDVLFNRGWLQAALQRHGFQSASGDGRRFRSAPPSALEIAAH